MKKDKKEGQATDLISIKRNINEELKKRSLSKSDLARELIEKLPECRDMSVPTIVGYLSEKGSTSLKILNAAHQYLGFSEITQKVETKVIKTHTYYVNN